MKSLVVIVALTFSCAWTQAQTNSQAAPPSTSGSMQQPGQEPPAPAGHPGQPVPQPGAAGGQQPAAGAPPPGSGNVASTLQVYAYPKGEQSPDKQVKDENECYQSAQAVSSGQGQPSAQQGQSPAQQGQSGKPGSGATVKGSAGGAATGAAIGAVAGDAGQGAAIGAIGGAAVGHRRKKKAQQEAAKEQKQQQQAQQAQATDNLKRAYTACMESRNYTVR
jgi:hypothetical protein